MLQRIQPEIDLPRRIRMPMNRNDAAFLAQLVDPVRHGLDSSRPVDLQLSLLLYQGTLSGAMASFWNLGFSPSVLEALDHQPPHAVTSSASWDSREVDQPARRSESRR